MNGHPYCIVLTTTSTSTVSDSVQWRIDNSTPTVAGTATDGYQTLWRFGGSAADLLFKVYTRSANAASRRPLRLAEPDHGAATTNRLTGGTGTFTAGKVSEDGLVDDLGWSGNNHTEVLYSLTLKAADLANGDTLRFRVLRNGATTGLTYTQTPTINVTSGAPGPPVPRPRNVRISNPAARGRSLGKEQHMASTSERLYVVRSGTSATNSTAVALVAATVKTVIAVLGRRPTRSA